MSRLSNATDRTVAVLNFFAEHPQQPFSLTQVLKSLRISRATCHAVLLTLVEAGYLYRMPDKSFVIGPGLIALGEKVQQHAGQSAVARQELRLLADELDVVAMALFLDGDGVLVRERAASLGHLGLMTAAEQRYPLRSPAMALLALLPQHEFEARLRAFAPPLPEDTLEDMRAQARFAQRHGFIMGVHAADSAWGEVGGIPWAAHPAGVTELDPDTAYRLRYLVAPVLDASDKLAFGLSISGFPRPVKGAVVLQIGERLCDAGARIGGFATGRRARIVA